MMYEIKTRAGKMKKLAAVLLATLMMASLLAGCGGSPSGEGQEVEESGEKSEGGKESADPSSGASDGQEENTAMGRYVETVTDLSEYCHSPKEIRRMSDDTLVISDALYQQIVSRDNGIEWNTEKPDWCRELEDNQNYVVSVSCGGDGTVGIIYSAEGEDKEDEESTEGESTEEESEDDIYYSNYRCMVIRPDGTRILVQVSLEEGDQYTREIWVTDTGRVFISTFGENIYEVNEEGMGEKFLTAERWPELIQFVGDLMVIDGSGYEKLLLYDMEKREFLEDEVLEDFVSENYGDRNFDNADCFDMFFFQGEEEGVIYIAGEKGLHRHVIGGSAIEQVIDGSLSSLSNPSYNIIGMTALPDNEFMALSYGGKLVRFTYNPDIPTVPNEKLKVYSLENNDTVRQAVSMYQIENPAVYVEYEIGEGEDNSIARDDALKKLNTQIMSGEGPDVLIMDDMPLDSYIEKNFLMDLSSCLESLGSEEELFQNIVDAFEIEGKIYTVPCEFQIPVMEGKKEYIAQMNDLEGIADVMEKLRAENPEEALIGICSERGIMRLLSMVSSPAWKNAQGELDSEAVKEFLTQSKRVYDAQMDGLPAEDIEKYMSTNMGFSSFFGGTRESSDYFRVADEIEYLMGKSKVLLGTVYYPHGVCEVFSVQKVKGHEDEVIMPMNGMSTNVFLPKTLIGINAASKNPGRAEEMVKLFLGRENQNYLFSGLPVNRAAFEKSFTADETLMSEDGIFSYVGVSTGEGESLTLEVYWLTEEQKQEVLGWVEAADTPYIEDTVLEEAVYSEGTSYMRGYKSVEEAVDAIEKSLEIYMSE